MGGVMGLSHFRLAASLSVVLWVAASQFVKAQDFGYAEALGALSVTCRQDIARLCPKANLGGRQVAECLEHNWAKVSLASTTSGRSKDGVD